MLIINGLRSDVKTIVMQHLPFETMDALANKAQHVEAALKPCVQAISHITNTAVQEKSDVHKAIEALTRKVASIVQRVSSESTNLQDRPREANFNIQPQVYNEADTMCYFCGHVNY